MAEPKPKAKPKSRGRIYTGLKGGNISRFFRLDQLPREDAVRANLILAGILAAIAALVFLLIVLTLAYRLIVSRGTMLAVLIPVFFLLLASALICTENARRGQTVALEEEKEAEENGKREEEGGK